MNLQNEFIRVELMNQGAQIRHFVQKSTGKDWIWSGDPNFWPQHNPILFPMVGSTFDGKIRWENHTTQMGNHGFTRYADFTCNKIESDHIQCTFVASAETLTQYPYEFELKVDYRLKGHALAIVYTIVNHSDRLMPFNFGLHPAFQTHYNGLDGPIDIRFSHPEPQMDASIVDAQDPYVIHLSDAFFERFPTYILEAPKSNYVELVEKDGCLRVYTSGYRWLAFWKKPQARFICIEPWHSHDDFEEKTQLFKDREGTLWLLPHHHFVSSICYEIHQGETHD